jgi:exodeoxyribonuclease V alpha subunit
MSPQSEPSTQEVLAGLVEQVTYHNAENGFCVLRARARGHRDVVTVVGHAATISAGEWNHGLRRMGFCARLMPVGR